MSTTPFPWTEVQEQAYTRAWEFTQQRRDEKIHERGVFTPNDLLEIMTVWMALFWNPEFLRRINTRWHQQSQAHPEKVVELKEDFMSMLGGDREPGTCVMLDLDADLDDLTTEQQAQEAYTRRQVGAQTAFFKRFMSHLGGEKQEAVQEYFSSLELATVVNRSREALGWEVFQLDWTTGMTTYEALRKHLEMAQAQEPWVVEDPRILLRWWKRVPKKEGTTLDLDLIEHPESFFYRLWEWPTEWNGARRTEVVMALLRFASPRILCLDPDWEEVAKDLWRTVLKPKTARPVLEKIATENGISFQSLTQWWSWVLKMIPILSSPITPDLWEAFYPSIDPLGPCLWEARLETMMFLDEAQQEFQREEESAKESTSQLLSFCEICAHNQERVQFHQGYVTCDSCLITVSNSVPWSDSWVGPFATEAWETESVNSEDCDGDTDSSGTSDSDSDRDSDGQVSTWVLASSNSDEIDDHNSESTTSSSDESDDSPGYPILARAIALSPPYPGEETLTGEALTAEMVQEDIEAYKLHHNRPTLEKMLTQSLERRPGTQWVLTLWETAEQASCERPELSPQQWHGLIAAYTTSLCPEGMAMLYRLWDVLMLDYLVTHAST